MLGYLVSYHISPYQVYKITKCILNLSIALVTASSSPFADAARLAVVYKYSGVYMDMDVVVIRTFPFSKSIDLAAGKQLENSINNAVIFSKKGNPLLFQAMQNFSK